MSTFVSSTVHCARCHDHKFDPITQEDYYNLQAVFAGIDKAHRMYDADPGVAEKRAGLHARLAQLEADSQSRDLAWITPEVLMQAGRWEAELRNRQPHWQPLQLVEFHSANGSELSLQPDGSLLSSGPRPERDTYTIATQTTLPEISAVRVEVLTDESLPHLGPGRQENGNLHLNEVVFKASPASDPSSLQSLKTQSPRADFNQNGWSIDKAFDNNPQTAWGIYPQVGTSHTFFVELAEPLKNASEQLLTLELQQTHGGGHLIGKLRLSAVSDPLSASVDFTPLPEEIAAILEIPSPDRTSDQRRIITAYCLKLDLEHQIAELPAQKQLYCGTNNFEAKGGFRPAAGPREIHLLKRGEITQPGPLAVPGTLSCVPNLPSKFELAQPENEALRRVALADWVADPRNVLTWRSIVNRIWHNHFGQGIVKTPNDFGHMGASPTHPELLDWLAVTFRDQGGSIKDLHRLIVCSATYRQASTHNSDAAQLDSNNQLLWRMNRQRLDAESIHDALLLLAGRLNTQMGGPPVKQFIETKTFNLRPEADYEHFNVDDPGNQRRSLYRFIYRTIPDPFMSALDCPDGTQLTPVRSESTTALQALAMLNDKFVIRQSEHLAEKLKTSQSELPDQVRAAFQLLLSREADLEEQQLVSDYAREYGLANACRFLMNTNEFLILD